MVKQYRYRELWIKDGAFWNCAGRLDEPAAILNGVWKDAVIPCVLMRFFEDENGAGCAECAWNDLASKMSDDEKERVLRSIAVASDRDTLGIVPPPALIC